MVGTNCGECKRRAKSCAPKCGTRLYTKLARRDDARLRHSVDHFGAMVTSLRVLRHSLLMSVRYTRAAEATVGERLMSWDDGGRTRRSR